MPCKDPEARRAYNRSYARAYRVANSETVKAYDREWKRSKRKANPEEDKARAATWRANHPEKIRQYEANRIAKNPEWYAYTMHKSRAKYRDIPFLLTFDEWLAIWTESGKFGQQGTSAGQYVMARTGDVGPYAIGNVRICTNGENSAERNRNQRGKPLSEAALKARSMGGKARWAKSITSIAT